MYMARSRNVKIHAIRSDLFARLNISAAIGVKFRDQRHSAMYDKFLKRNSTVVGIQLRYLMQPM